MTWDEIFMIPEPYHAERMWDYLEWWQTFITSDEGDEG